MSFWYCVLNGFVVCKVIGWYGVEFWEVGVFVDVIEVEINVVGDIGCICIINDVGFKCGEDFGEIYYDWFCIEFFEDFGFYVWG